MVTELNDYPGRDPKVGYSCQTWLARRVNELLHAGQYYCWYAANLNPLNNGDSSNPALLFLRLDRAVKQNDFNEAKIQQIRANLLVAIVYEMRVSGLPVDIAELTDHLEKLPITVYTPQRWAVSCDKVRDRSITSQYPEEFLVKDLRRDEFRIIVP